LPRDRDRRGGRDSRGRRVCWEIRLSECDFELVIAAARSVCRSATPLLVVCCRCNTTTTVEYIGKIREVGFNYSWDEGFNEQNFIESRGRGVPYTEGMGRNHGRHRRRKNEPAKLHFCAQLDDVQVESVHPPR